MSYPTNATTITLYVIPYKCNPPVDESPQKEEIICNCSRRNFVFKEISNTEIPHEDKLGGIGYKEAEDKVAAMILVEELNF